MEQTIVCPYGRLLIRQQKKRTGKQWEDPEGIDRTSIGTKNHPERATLRDPQLHDSCADIYFIAVTIPDTRVKGWGSGFLGSQLQKIRPMAGCPHCLSLR